MTRPAGIYFILATLLIDAIGVGLIFAIMPDLMARVGAPSTGEGSVWGGVLMAAYAAAQFIFGPAVGSLSDAVGRKPVLLAALAMLAVDYVIMAMAGSFWLLLLGRTLAGVSGATYITATAYIADISKPQERAASFGLIGAAFGVGFALGPAIGGLLGAVHITLPFWVAAGLSAANVVFGLLVLPESLPPERRRPFGRRDLNPFRAILEAFRLPGLALPLACLFVFEFANMVYPTLWAYWTEEVFGWASDLRGLSLTAYGILVAVSQAVIMPRAIAHLGEFRTLLFAMLAGVVAMIGFGLTASVAALFVFMPLAALSDLAPPTMTAMSANRVAEDQQGLIQGVIASLGSISAVIAPLVMTRLFRAYVSEEAGHYVPGAPFLFSAILVVAILPLVLRLNRAGAASST